MLTLSEDLEDFRTSIRAQAAAEIAPLAAEIDREQRFSPRLWEITRAMNLTGLAFSEEIGGQGGSYLAYVTAIEEVARAAAIAGLYPGTTVQVARVLEAHGTDAQRERWLAPLVRGDAIGCWAFTEPSTGSPDSAAASMRFLSSAGSPVRRANSPGWGPAGSTSAISSPISRWPGSPSHFTTDHPCIGRCDDRRTSSG